MNKQEHDDEIAAGIYTAEFWEYDSRTGRRWNQDPKPIASVSNYACFLNNPILYSDVNGDVVDYEKFRDRVNVFFSRLVSKTFRASYNRMKASEETYTFRKRDNYSELLDGGTTVKRVDETHLDALYSKVGTRPEKPKPEPQPEPLDKTRSPQQLEGKGDEFEAQYNVTDFHNSSLKIETFSVPDKIEIVSPGKPTILVTAKGTDKDGYTTTNKPTGDGPIVVNLEDKFNKGEIGNNFTIKITGGSTPASAGKATHWKYRIKADAGTEVSTSPTVKKETFKR